MPRRPKPTLHQGHYYTRAGGAWKKLCPEADGLAAAERALAALLGTDRPAAGPEPSPAAGRAADAVLSRLAGAVAAHLAHCRAYYTLPGGRVSSEPRGVELALGYLTRAAGADLPTAQLSADHLRAAVELMKPTCSRKTANQHAGRIKRFARWCAGKKLLPAAAALDVRAVEQLPAFRSGATEHEPVTAVPWEHVEKVVGVVGEPWKSLILVQWWSGLRPAEACGLGVDQVREAGGAIVLDFGLRHKSGWRGRRKVVPLGPNAAAVLRPHLDAARAGGREHVFACVWTAADGPRPCTPSSYAHAVARACKAAGVPPWSPNQLRHAHATRVREALGLEAAQVALGHARADVTQIYAETQASRAAEIAARLG